MTIKRKIASAAVAALNGGVKLTGPRFYKFFLDDVNRRFHDEGRTATIKAKTHDLHFVCPNRLTQWRAETLLSKEPSTIAWIDDFAPGAVLWDVGANVGTYSVYAAVARGARVLAFEPSPVNFALLSKNIEINQLTDRISAFALALGDKRMIGALNMQNTDPGGAFSTFGINDPVAPVRLSCLGFSIDDFIAQFDPPFPDHIKIDVDGIEDKIIAGATKTLSDSRLQSVSVELDDRDPAQTDRVQRALTSHRFRCTGHHRSPLFEGSPAQNYHFTR